MAHSAVAAGFDVSSIEAFGDLDHPRSAGLFTAAAGGGRRWRPNQVPALASAVAADAVAYGASLENHPAVVAELSRGRTLWGNPPDVLRRVRDPRLLSEVLRANGHHAPDVMLPGDLCPDDAGTAWLLKPRQSGGGRHVRPWRRGASVPASCYAQRRIEGEPGSVLFVAARGRAVPLGITRQLVGDPAFGAAGFRYCGSLLRSFAHAEADAWNAPAAALADTVASAFELAGVGGVDFIARNGVVHAIEVNPRWTSSMELVERVWGRPLFEVHARACIEGRLPTVNDDGFVASRSRTYGKAIVFARRDVRLGDTRAWLTEDIADVPRPWTHVRAGHPVCTVFGDGVEEAWCRDTLVRRANLIYGQLDRWDEEAE